MTVDQKETLGSRERFWAKVDRGEVAECWEWLAYKDPKGYGRMKVGGSMGLSHRIAWRLTRGDPSGKWVLHTCDNPACVNPDHLYLGTPSDNLQDAWDRDRRSAAGESNPRAKLSEGDVRAIRKRLSSGNETHREIAADYSVSRAAISMISTGERWSTPND